MRIADLDDYIMNSPLYWLVIIGKLNHGLFAIATGTAMVSHLFDGRLVSPALDVLIGSFLFGVAAAAVVGSAQYLHSRKIRAKE